jgi:hypothetical protein
MSFRTFVVATALLGACVPFRAAPPPPLPAAADEPAEARPGLRPYGSVVTAEAVSDSGLFIAHRVGDKLFYEIPAAELGREMLWAVRAAQVQSGTGLPGQQIASRLIRWERRGDRVLLRGVIDEVLADTSLAIARAVRDTRVEPIIRAFEVKAESAAGDPVIEVTSIFLSDVPEFTARHQFQASRQDPERSAFQEVLAFPGNLEVRVLATFDSDQVPEYHGQWGIVRNPGSISAVLHHSLLRLPDEPMRPRRLDPRVGYQSVAKVDYGSEAHRADEIAFATRWRLEKLHPELPVSPPVRPIVFHIDPATPEQWRPWIRRGVEAWQEAFRAAGFERAVVARDAPTPGEDPRWRAEDLRHSMIRWLPSRVQNAMGPHVNDPRSGEILQAHVELHHNIMSLLGSWYFVQAGAADPRATTLPLPDEVMGELLMHLVAHEVGHALGLEHNLKASSSVPVDSLRSATFTRREGISPSIMDYARFNYVAQPGDGALLITMPGAYDHFAIEWGYLPVPGGASVEEERAILEGIVRRQLTDPRLAFAPLDGLDPTAQEEDLGDDPLRATEFGLRNLRRIVPRLVEAAQRPGEDHAQLRDAYLHTVAQWTRELEHVARLVGGVVRTPHHGWVDGPVHTPVPAARQRAAVAFLNREAFTRPDFLLDAELLRRFEPAGSLDRIRRHQARILGVALSVARLERLLEQEALDPAGTYPAAELLRDVRRGVWGELAAGGVRIDPVRRNLQRAHLDLLEQQLTAAPGSGSDLRALLRGELRDLSAAIGSALPRSGDRAVRLHLEESRERITRLLDPR